VFIIYLNMLSAAKAWIEQGAVSPMVGLWWVHGAMLLLALFLLGAQNSVHKRIFR
jgi:lipopolysaccharide export system permease protein